MAENTKIEWAHHTFNPWEGCQKVGPGCDHCYAEARNARFAGGQAINWGPGAPRRRTSASNWAMPVKWNKQAQAAGIRFRVFCASLADVFDNEVDPEWRRDLLRLIASTQNLDWLLLTKRIGNASVMLAEAASTFGMTWGDHWRNVWIGATIVNQAEADRDLNKLLEIPARVHFISYEPALGPINIMPWLKPIDVLRPDPHGRDRSLSWVICGGESGPNARPMHPAWARSLRNQCQATGVPFLFKQWGEWGLAWWEQHKHLDGLPPPDPAGEKAIAGSIMRVGRYDEMWPVVKVGKKAAGRLLEGRTWDEVPS